MNLQPSISTLFNDRRELFAWELSFGGHGQIPLTGAGTYIAPNGYVFYAIDFLSDSVISSVVFRNINEENESIYNVTNSSYNNFSFPVGYTWMAPTTSVTLSTGTGIAYMYKKFIPEDLYCSAC